MKMTLIVVVIVLLSIIGFCVYVLPTSTPYKWASITHKLSKHDIYHLIGPPTEVDSEAQWDIWYEDRWNGRWALQIRYAHDGTVGVGDYTFQNAFFDAEWNPLPKPYTLANYTTTAIP